MYGLFMLGNAYTNLLFKTLFFKTLLVFAALLEIAYKCCPVDEIATLVQCELGLELRNHDSP